MCMRISAALAAAGLVLAAVAVSAAPAIDPTVFVGSSRIDPESIRGHIAALTDSSWVGRALASPGADSAAAYIRERFRAAGLDPGTEGSFYLSLPVSIATRVEGIIGLRDRRRGYTFGQDWSPLGLTSNGHVLAPLAVAGYGITAPEAGYDDYSGLDVTGKVVLVLAGEPPREKGAPLIEAGPAYCADPFVKAMNARRHGALGLLVTGPPPWPGGISPAWRIDEQQGFLDAGIPACHLSWTAAESLLAESGLDLRALRRGEPLAADHFPQDSACDSVEMICALRRLDGYAVDIVGRLPGRVPGTVIVAAAYDGWGTGHDNSNPAGRPGAGDNAAGVALLLELAAAMHESPPLDRTVLFAAYAGRTFDAAGVAPLLEKIRAQGERVVAFVDLGGFGAKPAKRLFISGSGSAEEWPELLDGVRKGLSHSPGIRLISATPSSGALPQCKAALVPAILVSTGGSTRSGDPADAPSDLDPDGLARLARYIHGVVGVLASEKIVLSVRGAKE